VVALLSLVVAESSGTTVTFFAKHQAELTDRLRSILLNVSDPRHTQYGESTTWERPAGDGGVP
jgi:hypothetical protein